MKQIQLNHDLDDVLSYPVGENMVQAAKFSGRAARQFMKIEEFYGKTVLVVGRGSSGSILGALFIQTILLASREADAVAHYSDIQLVYLRKEAETLHSGNFESAMELIGNANECIVVIDDFIDSGSTMIAIMEFIKSVRRKPDCIILEGGMDQLIPYFEEQQMLPSYYLSMGDYDIEAKIDSYEKEHPNKIQAKIAKKRSKNAELAIAA